MSWLRPSDGFLLRMIRGTEWSQFVDYVSPSFLDVVPLGGLVAQARELAANAKDGRRFGAVRERLNQVLRERGLEVRTCGALPRGRIRRAGPEIGRTLGERALEIYFLQLYELEETVFDLRASSFAVDDSGVQWAPRPFYIAWAPGFLDAVRQLYRGFYAGSQDDFRGALERLGLACAEDIFRSHFGEGDQRDVRFDRRAFHSTFHDAFVRCREAGVQLDPNFLGLGLYLACLHDHLASVEAGFDVRAAFERAVLS